MEENKPQENQEIKDKDIATFKKKSLLERHINVNANGDKQLQLVNALNELDKRLQLAEEALGYLASWIQDEENKKAQASTIIGVKDNNIILPKD